MELDGVIADAESGRDLPVWPDLRRPDQAPRARAGSRRAAGLIRRRRRAPQQAPAAATAQRRSTLRRGRRPRPQLRSAGVRAKAPHGAAAARGDASLGGLRQQEHRGRRVESASAPAEAAGSATPARRTTAKIAGFGERGGFANHFDPSPFGEQHVQPGPHGEAGRDQTHADQSDSRAKILNAAAARPRRPGVTATRSMRPPRTISTCTSCPPPGIETGHET